MGPPNFITLIGLLFFASPLQTWAANRALVLGGSCEIDIQPDGSIELDPENQFYNTIEQTALGLVSQGWEVLVNYSGPQARCTSTAYEPECRVSNPPAHCCNIEPTDFDLEFWNPSPLEEQLSQQPHSIIRPTVETNTLQSALTSLDQITSQSQSGDQVLILFRTHGGVDRQGNQKLCFEDGNVSVNDPRLTARLQSLRDRGIELGFINGSCHSGASINTFENFGCVVSSAPSTGFGYSLSARTAPMDSPTFAASLLLTLNPDGFDLESLHTLGGETQPQLNMDDLYLLSLFRAWAGRGLDQPQISGDPALRNSHNQWVGYLSAIEALSEDLTANPFIWATRRQQSLPDFDLESCEAEELLQNTTLMSDQLQAIVGIANHAELETQAEALASALSRQLTDREFPTLEDLQVRLGSNLQFIREHLTEIVAQQDRLYELQDEFYFAEYINEPNDSILERARLLFGSRDYRFLTENGISFEIPPSIPRDQVRALYAERLSQPALALQLAERGYTLDDLLEAQDLISNEISEKYRTDPNYATTLDRYFQGQQEFFRAQNSFLSDLQEQPGGTTLLRDLNALRVYRHLQDRQSLAPSTSPTPGSLESCSQFELTGL